MIKKIHNIGATPATLPGIVARPKKRVGRGIGSGKGGHTVGRGQKGQKSREKVPVSFFGTKVKKSIIKRIPMQRGKGKLRAEKKITIRLGRLDRFPANTKVDKELLRSSGLLSKNVDKIKIVSGGALKKPLIVTLATSKGARQSIEKAGGKVTQ